VSSQIFPPKWSARNRLDDGEQQPISPVEREFGAESHSKRHGLEIIRALADAWGNPQLKYRTIHVAGSKGKGSTVAILSSILRSAGYRVGAYTSPSLTCFGERIQVNGEPLRDELAQTYVAELVSLAAMLPDRPRFFEAATAIAFQHFARENVDIAVIEVGLGGRLDATNIVRPEMAIITSIELEHTQVLGDTLHAIATEKAGIIKDGVPAITAVREPEALSAIEQACAARHAPLWRLGRDFHVANRRGSCTGQQFDLVFEPGLGGAALPELHLNLAGDAQCDNAALAVAATLLLQTPFDPISEPVIRAGLSAVRWPGRLELIPGQPAMLLDVAHTPASARQLRHHLEKSFAALPKTLVVGMLRDKKHSEVSRELAGVFDRVFVAPVKWYRSLDADRLRESFAAHHEAVRIAPTICSAVELARRATPPSGLVVVAGSLFAVGEVKRKYGW
jgi:dihydrofolate synthase/folylpolyglutamate synthase